MDPNINLSDSPEEVDQLQRSKKKYKRHASGEMIPLMERDTQPAVWGAKSFTEVLRGDSRPRSVYTGDDEDSDAELTDMEDMMHDPTEGEIRVGRIAMVIPNKECRTLRRPWRIWNLNQGCEIIDMEEGYYVIRFYSKEDYQHVLENGPWLIQGHYLTVMKWRP